MLGLLFDGEKTVADYILATPKDNLEHFLVMVKALLEPLFDKAESLKGEVVKIGIGIAGAIGTDGTIVNSPNIPILNGVKLGDKLQALFSPEIKIDNDANCFVRAEAMRGAGKKFNNLYGVIIGTGIGGGWWLDQRIYTNKFGGDGEPGEMIIDFAENIRLEPAFHKLTQSNPASLADEAYRGDVLAEKAFVEVGEMLGKALANISNLIGPEAYILGGGVVSSSDLFLPALKNSWRDNVVSPQLKKHTKILKSKLGSRAGAIGAALL